jgi:hypothetical protein
LYLIKIGGNLWILCTAPQQCITVLYEQAPQVMAVVRLGFTIWFTSRYLIFKVSCFALLELCPFYGPNSDILPVFRAGELRRTYHQGYLDQKANIRIS